MKFESDIIKSARGDDNLVIVLRIDTDDHGDYWEVIVFKDDITWQKFMSRVEEEVSAMYDKWYKEF